MLQRLRVLVLLTAAFFGLAPTLSGTRPLMIQHVVLASTTDWEVEEVPAWCRQVCVKNEHASGSLSWGNPGETGAYSSANDEYALVPAGAALCLPISAGQSAPPTAAISIPLFSATASLPVAVICLESPE